MMGVMMPKQNDPKLAQNGGELAQTGARQFDLLLVDWRTGATAPVALQFQGTGATKGAASRLVANSSLEKTGAPTHGRVAPPDLRLRLQTINRELQEANDEVDAANEAQAPYRAAFEAVHAKLVAISQKRAQGVKFVRSIVMGLYDERMEAGHAWHPHRERLKRAEAAKRAIVEEIREINEEMGW